MVHLYIRLPDPPPVTSAYLLCMDVVIFLLFGYALLSKINGWRSKLNGKSAG
jgi:hypothetical protein